MNIYLAGPMSGIENYNIPEFDRYAKALRDRGYEVHSPADLTRKIHEDRPEDIGRLEWHEYLRNDIANGLLLCERIALMPGWTKSRGARLELHIAHHLKFKVYRIHEDTKLERAYTWGSQVPE